MHILYLNVIMINISLNIKSFNFLTQNIWNIQTFVLHLHMLNINKAFNDGKEDRIRWI